jgi:tRNA (guanine-N7-)-methyltransferase
MSNQKPPDQHRKIRSFVRREGRFTPAQRDAFERLWPTFGLDPNQGPWNLTELFGREAPVILELGFGDGRVLKMQAARDPGIDFLGVEVHRPGVGRLMRELDQDDILNVRLACADGAEILAHNIAEQSLSGILIFFPDPWHKKRHHKRRLIQPDFIHMAASRLKRGGILHMATDWEEYAEQMLAVLNAEPMLVNTIADGGFAVRPEQRPVTKYEERGQRLGHGVWDLVFKRK